jgi:hypothetical protein
MTSRVPNNEGGLNWNYRLVLTRSKRNRDLNLTGVWRPLCKGKKRIKVDENSSHQIIRYKKREEKWLGGPLAR